MANPRFRQIQHLLSDHQSRVFQAKGVLELAAQKLTDGPLDWQEQDQVLGAVEAAIRLLTPIDNLSDAIALDQARRSRAVGEEVSNGRAS